MNKNYLTLLLIATIASSTAAFGGTPGKAIALGLGIWFISTKNIAYFPLLAIITSFLSTGYLLYIQMFFICLANFETLRKRGLSTLFLIYTLMIITVLFYAFVKLQTSNINIGTSLKDYIFVLALSPFFYGAVVYSKYSKNDFDWERIFDALIIPFLFTYIFINFSDTSQLKKIIYSGLVLLYYLGTDGITFTLIFSAFISILLIRRKVKSTIVPFVLVLLVVYIPIYAINNSDDLDFTDFIDLDMSDIRTLDDFNGRLGMKLIEDRGPIWTSAWNYLKENISILPPLDKYKLFVKSKLNSETEWEFHSHNLALESLLNLGLITGILVLIFFLYINFTSVKGLNYQRLKPIAKIFIIVSVVSNIVGSMSGIFPLLLDYAFLPLVIMGAYYYNKKTIFK